MRQLLILAALCAVLFARSPPIRTPGSYQCKEDQDEAASKEAEQFINEQHRHGYKFKLSHVDGRTLERESHPCMLNLALTLVETKCYVVDPKSLDECVPREQHEVKVESKCNVTICGGGDYPGIRQFNCDTEPESNESILLKCPDCPILLPLDNEQGLESVQAAVKKFNKASNHASYFKLMEVGRIITYYIPGIGMNYNAEFAVVETECSDKATAEDKNCEQKCPHEADYGFCTSTKRENGELTVDCSIYDNSTRHSYLPFLHEKHCEDHKHRPGSKGHQDKDKDASEALSLDQSGSNRPDVPFGCYFSSIHSDYPHYHRGHHGHHHHGHHHHHHHHHEGHRHPGDHHPGGPHDKKHKEPHDKHPDHHHDHKEPHPTPIEPPSGPPTGCPGLDKLQPSIHPICPFPPTLHRRRPKLPQVLQVPVSEAH